MEKLIERIKKLVEKTHELETKYFLEKGKYNYEYDSSPKAWKYFLDVYNSILECDGESIVNMHMENYRKSHFWKQSQKGYYRVVGTFEYATNELVTSLRLGDKKLKDEGNIGIAGDCVFNFNEKKKEVFYDRIVKKEKLNESDKELINSILDLCQKDMHHSFYNLSLMPTNGAMQRAKGQRSDRLDIFLNNLEDYYNKVSLNILSGTSKGKGRDALKAFLDNVGSFENYCRMFYHIDEKKKKDKILLNDLCNNGSKPISDYKDLVTYIELAVRYWEHQAEYYEDIQKESPNHAKIQNNET